MIISKNIYINCYSNLMLFNSREKAKDYFLECISASEGAERDRYTNIYLDLQIAQNRFIDDGSVYICSSNIDFNSISKEDLKEIMINYNLEDNDINSLMAQNELNKIGKRIYQYDLDKHDNDFLEYYNQLKYDKSDKFYHFSDDMAVITCFDVYGSDLYYSEDFDMKDYHMAYKWLNNEIEYDEYLEYKNKEDDICL